MTEMVARVAKAMKEANDATGAEDEAIFEASWQTLARTAIEAMREPTEEVLEAIKIEAAIQFGIKIGAVSIWEAGIDAALNAKKPPPRD